MFQELLRMKANLPTTSGRSGGRRAALLAVLFVCTGPLGATEDPPHCTGSALETAKRHNDHDMTWGEGCLREHDPHFSTDDNAHTECDAATNSCQACVACCNSRFDRISNCTCSEIGGIGGSLCRGIASRARDTCRFGQCPGTNEGNGCEGIDLEFRIQEDPADSDPAEPEP